LSERRLVFYEAIETMDPVVADLRNALSETPHVADAVNTLVALIRSHGTLGECDLTMSKNGRANALLRRLMRGVDAIRAPAPSFTPPSSLHFVGSIGELRQIARKFENCLTRMDHYATQHWFGLADGSVVFLARDEPPLIIALRQVGPSVWRIEEVGGPMGPSPTIMVRKAIETALKEVGVNLVTMDGPHAIWKLYEIAKRRPKGHDDEIIDDLDNVLPAFEA
jgi:hypothetical protein